MNHPCIYQKDCLLCSDLCGSQSVVRTVLGPEVRQHEMGKTWQRRLVLFGEAKKKKAARKAGEIVS